MVPGFSDPRCPPLLNVTNYPSETRHQELAVTDLISQILGASTFCCCFFTHNKARAANLKIVERFGDSALSFFHFLDFTESHQKPYCITLDSSKKSLKGSVLFSTL